VEGSRLLGGILRIVHDVIVWRRLCDKIFIGGDVNDGGEQLLVGRG